MKGQHKMRVNTKGREHLAALADVNMNSQTQGKRVFCLLVGCCRPSKILYLSLHLNAKSLGSYS